MRPYLVLILTALSFIAFSQEQSPNYYSAPVNIPLFLTGNFAELRSNHFHSGIDIKTEGRTGIPVLASAEGFISRINISPSGFGNALYMDHPNGTTTVYCHLEAFSKKIETYIREIQYKQESFRVDVAVPKDQFPIKKGEVIAFSGNTGSSGGPHLHFEIRDSQSQHTLNPLKYHFDIKDGISPKVLSVLIYPVSDDALVAGRTTKQRYETVFYDKAYHIQKNPTISVFGTIGFGIQTIDYLDGNWSKCGIYSLSLKVDDKTIYSFRMDEFSFDESRYINSHTDYDQKIRFNRSLYKTWIEPGNELSIYDRSLGDGLFEFSDEKLHKISYEITDVYGNKSVADFNVSSKKQVVKRVPEEGIPFKFDTNNTFENNDIEIEFEEGTFYNDFKFRYELKPQFAGVFSDVHAIHDMHMPVHKYFTVRVKTNDLPRKLQSKALLAYVNPQTHRLAALTGEYKNGWIEGKIRGFGDVAVAVDTIAPSISSLSLKNGSLVESSQIRFRISDSFSGIDSFKGTIDDKWVLFEYDAKNNLIVYKFDKERFDFGKKHLLVLKVADARGNVKNYESSFYK